jgi:methyltransferase-like protein
VTRLQSDLFPTDTSYLFHEHLEDVNEPIYFHQFAERAQAKGLQYLAEADLSVMVPGNYPPEIENVLQMLAQDLIHMEQYMDFLRNRMFRQTLLCHDRQRPSYRLSPELLTPFHIASPVRPKKEKPDLTSPEPEDFEGPSGIGLNSRDPLVKAAMVHLAEQWPRAVPFPALCEAARQLSGSGASGTDKAASDVQALGQALLTFYASASTSLVELWLHPPRLPASLPERPVASPLARLQAAHHEYVTNLRHEQVYLGEFERHLLRLLDGAHDREALVEGLTRVVEEGELLVEDGGERIYDGERLRELLAQAVDRQLPLLLRGALLLPENAG